MEIETELKLPKYTETKVMMDNNSVSMTELMSRFDTFNVDEVSIEDAEDDIRFNSKDIFDYSRVVSLIGLITLKSKVLLSGIKVEVCLATEWARAWHSFGHNK